MLLLKHDQEEGEIYRLGTSVDASFSTGTVPWISIKSLLGKTFEGKKGKKQDNINSPNQTKN